MRQRAAMMNKKKKEQEAQQKKKKDEEAKKKKEGQKKRKAQDQAEAGPSKKRVTRPKENPKEKAFREKHGLSKKEWDQMIRSSKVM